MTKHGLKLGCALGALLLGMPPLAAAAQTAPRAAPAPAQTPPEETPPEEEEAEIVVSGQLRGGVPGPVKPEVQLSPADIRAYGASNITELVTSLSAQLGSSSGRGGEQPVILLSGRRSSFREIQDLPTEAIERIDILPEEAALQFGYGATQKVINFVLRRRFQSLTVELEGRAPTDGGQIGENGEIGITKINRDGRFGLNVEYDHSSALLESERGVTRAGSSLFDTRGNIVGIPGPGGVTPPLGSVEIDPALSAAAGSIVTVAGVPDGIGNAPTLAAFVPGANRANVADLTDYRTLRGPQKNLTIGGVYNRVLSPKITATANVRVEATESESWLGLPSVTLRLPTGNPFSPFSRDVQLLRYLDTLAPLSRASSGQNLSGGVTVNGDSSPWSSSWRWSFNGTYERRANETFTSRGVSAAPMQARLDADDPGFNPFGPIPTSAVSVRPADIAHTLSSVGRVELQTNGPLFSVPAGKVNASLRVIGRTSDFSSDSLRSTVFSRADFARDSVNVRGNINVPISRRGTFLDAIGDLSVNANFEIEQLSDFGRLVTTGYGFNWSPIKQISANVSWIHDRSAPSEQQLGNPLITTPNYRIFDYVRGESVDVTRTDGGNPALRADNRNVFRVGLNIRPLEETNLTLVANYTEQHFRNQTDSLPDATAEIQAAFPDRFVRDADGFLTSVDFRPINYARADRQELRWGFNLFVPIPSPAAKRMAARREAFQKAREESRRTGQPMPPEMTAQLERFRRAGQQQSLLGGGNPFQRGQGQGQGQGQGARDGQDGGRGDGQGGGRRFGGGGGGGGGRGFGGRSGGGGGNVIQLAAYHTWVFRDEVLIRSGLPVLDRLDGAPGRGGQGQPSHKLEFQAGVQRDGYRLRLEGNWESATEVASGALGSNDRLRFGSLAKVNLTAQLDLGQQLDWVLKHPWLRGSRVSFRVDNLFNARQRVLDSAGETPAAYAPNLRDPLGRVVRISFRKLFI